MNSTLAFLLLPITTLFSPAVYRDAARSSAGKGVLYILYWSVLMTLIVAVMFVAVILPQGDRFMNWAKKELPVAIWTPDGLSLENGQQTAKLASPQYGTIALFDMAKTTVTEADMGDAYFFVTAKKVFVKRGPKTIEEHDITKAGIQTQQRLPERVRVTGELAGKLYQNLKGTFLFIVPMVTLLMSFLLMMISNLFYSLIGLLLNLIREEKLRYGAVFNLTCLATGVSLTLTLLKVISPLRGIPIPFFVSVLIILIYMVVMFKLTDQRKAKA